MENHNHKDDNMNIIDTSALADASIETIKYKLQRTVYAYLKDHPEGLIHQSLEDHFAPQYGPSTIRMRCAELERQGWVRWTGRYGLTRANRKAKVWVAV